MYNLALVGVWNGTLLVGSSQLLVIFNFIYVNSYIKGYLDVPIQSVSKLPFYEIQSQNDSIAFNVTSIKAHYRGSFSNDLQSIAGIYEQNGSILDLTLQKTSNRSAYSINRPQTPVRPFSYIEEEVKFENRESNITLSGTLTYQNNIKPIALVVLAHGSGGQDRDETMFDHKPFMVIADHLTKHNIAVLRYDERGIGKSTGDFESATDIEFSKDVLAGVQFVQTHSKLSGVSNIGVIGQSKGGCTAVIATSLSKLVKFIAFVGSPAMDGENILYLQTRLFLQANNYSEYYIDKVLKTNKDVYQIIKQESDFEKAEEEIIRFYDNLISISNDFDKILYLEFKESTLSQILSITSPWFRSFLVFDPRTILSETKIPILGLWGSNDLHVPANENLNEMKKALEKANNKNFELKILNGLNHLFQNSTTGNIDEYERLEETFSVEALDMISDWIKEISVNAAQVFLPFTYLIFVFQIYWLVV
jgi:dienelactone hydrolase